MAPVKHLFERASRRIVEATGTATAFFLAVAAIVAWAAGGPALHYSERWQLIVNTGTTIVTFLMVFLIQHQQNKDSLAIHLKLNELIAATKGASNRLIDAEDFTEDELRAIHRYFELLGDEAERDVDPGKARSFEEAGHGLEVHHREGHPRKDPAQNLTRR